MATRETFLAWAESDAEREVMQRQIEGTDRQTDALVNELYRLTDEEVAVVEARQVG